MLISIGHLKIRDIQGLGFDARIIVNGEAPHSLEPFIGDHCRSKSSLGQIGPGPAVVVGAREDRSRHGFFSFPKRKYLPRRYPATNRRARSVRENECED